MEACGMDEAKPMKWKIAAAAGGLVLVVLLVALALRADLITTPPPAAATGPLKIVAFQDGAELEILGVSVGERVVEVSPAKKFSLPFLHSKGSSGGTYGGLNVDT
jgi:hypothetical protein